VWIVGWDRRELLARIAGSFSSAGLNILSADVYTRGDSLVLDFFRVCNTKFEAVTDPKEWQQVEKRLATALAEEDVDFGPLLMKAIKRRGFHLSQEVDFPTRIVIENDAHPTYTLVDIQTPDRLGLLYNLLRALGSMDIQIALSRITTEKGAAIDSFYVTDPEGRKVKSADSLVRLQQALWIASQALSPHPRFWTPDKLEV
jgi:[protein-PII] uridylyltransferase